MTIEWTEAEITKDREVDRWAYAFLIVPPGNSWPPEKDISFRASVHFYGGYHAKEFPTQEDAERWCREAAIEVLRRELEELEAAE